jgi:hypothetical protein
MSGLEFIARENALLGVAASSEVSKPRRRNDTEQDKDEDNDKDCAQRHGGPPQSLETKREADARPVIGSRSVVVRIWRIVVRVVVVRAVIDGWSVVSAVAITAMAISVSAFLRLIPISLPTRFGSS